MPPLSSLEPPEYTDLQNLVRYLYGCLIYLPDGLPDRGTAAWTNAQVEQLVTLSVVCGTDGDTLARRAAHALQDVRRVIERQYNERNIVDDGSGEAARTVNTQMRQSQVHILLGQYVPARDAGIRALALLAELPPA